MTKSVRGFIIGTAAVLTSLLTLGGAITPGSAASASPAALSPLRPGLWTLRQAGAGQMPQRLCVSDPAQFIQVRHQGNVCSRLVLADQGHDATIHYSCPGAGWGRTELRVESATSLRIDTQGIADNAPFAYRAEARRDGDCRH